MTTHRTVLPALALLLVPALAACGDDPAPEAGSGWPAAEGTVEARGLVWAAGPTIHLGDGTTLDAGDPVRAFVVGEGGAYVVPDTRSDDETWPELVRVDGQGRQGLGVHAEPDSLSLSPDRRYLAFLDHGGERDAYDTPLAEAVVVDLRTGREVHRSAEGMGDPATDDLADLYEDAPPAVLGVSADHAYFLTPGEVVAVELASGEAEVVSDANSGYDDQPWYAALSSEPELTSPGGAWTIRQPPRGAPQLVPAAGGAPVTTRLTAADLGVDPLEPQPRDLGWRLDSWLDDATAAGIATVSASLDGAQTFPLVTCTVPDGACRVVPGTEDGAILPESRAGGAVVPTPLP
ncbi:hypothetical protein CFH99_24845 [Nocardioides aromaticivorans]|uniref:Uncharacterized protein n=1 Tax=Nocardioides aromaticivorans TaxID=200618 RepID=A0ABX7PT96_9ACTN|nr:hypothetical protein [Nocardioides aromaticivorans]QSR28853.1 hypothetical protein CFH99_24845 [Nocardioides aromaticivorans]